MLAWVILSGLSGKRTRTLGSRTDSDGDPSLRLLGDEPRGIELHSHAESLFLAIWKETAQFIDNVLGLTEHEPALLEFLDQDCAILNIET